MGTRCVGRRGYRRTSELGGGGPLGQKCKNDEQSAVRWSGSLETVSIIGQLCLSFGRLRLMSGCG